MTEGDGVDEFKARAGGNPRGETGDLHAKGREFLGQVESGSFSAGIGSKTKDDFRDFVLFRPLKEFGKFQFIRTDSVQRGEKSAEDMISALESPGALEIQDIGRMFDHAEEGRVTVFIPANFTEAFFRKKSAFGAGFDLGPGLFDGMSQILRGARGGGK